MFGNDKTKGPKHNLQMKVKIKELLWTQMWRVSGITRTRYARLISKIIMVSQIIQNIFESNKTKGHWQDNENRLRSLMPERKEPNFANNYNNKYISVETLITERMIPSRTNVHQQRYRLSYSNKNTQCMFGITCIIHVHVRSKSKNWNAK